MTEYEVQKDICRWLDDNLPPTAWYCHIPNGGYRKVREMAKLKAMGLKPGTPDLLILYRVAGVHGPWVIWLEVKADITTEPTLQQKEVMSKLRSLGCWTLTVASVEHVAGVLRHLGIPLKGDEQDGS